MTKKTVNIRLTNRELRALNLRVPAVGTLEYRQLVKRLESYYNRSLLASERRLLAQCAHVSGNDDALRVGRLKQQRLAQRTIYSVHASSKRKSK